MIAPDADLIRALFVHAPRLNRTQHVLLHRERLGGALAELLRQHEDRIDIADPVKATFVLINAVMGVFQTVFLADEEHDLDEVERHLNRLVLGYLRYAPAQDQIAGR